MTTIADQVYIFLYAILGGAIIALLYDVLRIKRRAIKTGVIIVNLEDILYWLIAAVLMFVMVYNSNNGEMRGYIFIGNVIGVMLYLTLLSHIIIASSMMIINITKKIFIFLWKILSYPFKLIIRILIIPLSFILRVISKILHISASKTRILTKRIWGASKNKIKGVNIGSKIARKVKKKLKQKRSFNRSIE